MFFKAGCIHMLQSQSINQAAIMVCFNQIDEILVSMTAHVTPCHMCSHIKGLGYNTGLYAAVIPLTALQYISGAAKLWYFKHVLKPVQQR